MISEQWWNGSLGIYNRSLCYGPTGLKCIGFVNTNFAGDRNMRHSTIWYMFSMTGGAMSLESKLHSVVPLSIIEKENINCIAYACKEAI